MAYTKEFIEQMADSQREFVWEAPAWERHDRHPRWYIWMALVMLVLTGYAVFTSNFLFAFILLLSGIILVLAGNEDPHTALVQIGHNGVVVDGKLHTFDQFQDFAIIYHPPETKILYFEPKGYPKARLRISLEEENPIPIRDLLKQYLDEDLDLRNEHWSDIFGRFLRI
jgi:hypothetical protein